MLKLKQNLQTKQKLSNTLRSWLPLLHVGLDGLNEAIEPFKEQNPFLQITPSQEIIKNNSYKDFFKKATNNYVSDTIEAVSVSKKSLYDVLFEQINPPLFPTKKSQDIAYKIIEYLNPEGYFEYEKCILDELNCTYEQLEKIRLRFCFLEPVGVGAVDFKEAFLFALQNLQIDDECYKSVEKLIKNFENMQSLSKMKNFTKALDIIKTFQIPPAIEYLDNSLQIIPDIFVYQHKNTIEISINDEFYPQINIDTQGVDESDEFVSQKIKEAKDLLDALQMRKATLRKIGLNIIEHQYDFFNGGMLKPMTLKDLATAMQRSPSTISRAIANKYISCQRGVIALKDFFTTAIDTKTSNTSIKNYISENISYENHQKPLSDLKILKMVQNQFNITLSRRTITKYRKQLNIASSSERKKLYLLQ